MDKDKLRERMKLLRIQHDWTQKEAAKKLGISKTAYSHYETGTNLPSIPTLIEIARIFHCSLDYLVGLSDVKRVEIGHLSDKEQKVILEMIECLDKSKH
ncbi:HTH-type transcriptional regulator ImmR [Eubacterium callanderi]|uniref:helix-turn-helix transcriptional regulator n=1 Tax=Eubacterium callanderi TaxID=53442 RepID=UPI0029FEE973|nr:helix-turn-helix transcriptional regulator [Eubacterium callanderi]WPK69898.1 HTH-type transcriptional regulator ImmR [Eubacterium callanderi]WPK74196.1 HTH-type transcriptional regulator ImmR [Eubacterium callanderi]